MAEIGNHHFRPVDELPFVVEDDVPLASGQVAITPLGIGMGLRSLPSSTICCSSYHRRNLLFHDIETLETVAVMGSRKSQGVVSLPDDPSTIAVNHCSSKDENRVDVYNLSTTSVGPVPRIRMDIPSNRRVGRVGSFMSSRFGRSILLSASYDYRVYINHPESGECLTSFEFGTVVQAMTLFESQEGKDLVFLGGGYAGSSRPSSEKEIRSFDLPTGRFLSAYVGHVGTVKGLISGSSNETSRSKKTVYSCSSDKTIRSWSLDTGQCEFAFKLTAVGLCLLYLSPQTVVCGTSQGMAEFWDVRTCRRRLLKHVHPDANLSAMTHVAKRIASLDSSGYGCLCLWNRSGDVLKNVRTRELTWNCCCCSKELPCSFSKDELERIEFLRQLDENVVPVVRVNIARTQLHAWVSVFNRISD